MTQQARTIWTFAITSIALFMVVLDNLVYGHRAAIDPGITLHEGNLGDETLVGPILREEKIDVVMHFAAYCYVGESVTDPLKYYFNNVVATLHLLQAMLEANVKKFVFSSTCATFGVPQTLPIHEDLPQAPINPYGQTKLDIEHALKSLAHANGLSFAAFRYFNAAGASEDGLIGEDHSPETHLIPLAVDAAVGKRPALQVFGNDYPTPDGTCLRDYVHVDDLSRAHIGVFEKLEKPGTALFYNLGTGKPTSVLEVIRAVEKTSRILSALLASIAAVSLLVGGIGIMNIQLVSVAERTTEIGIRAAIGASPRQIMAQFLTEAALLSLIGTVLGLGISYIADRYRLIELPADVYQIPYLPFRVEPLDVLTVIVAAVAICLLATIYPSRQAARIDPAEALRNQ